MNLIFGSSIHGYNILAIFWNLLLILIPCFTVYALATSVGRRTWAKLTTGDKAAFALLFLFWLFWLPNTAYQFMIPRHLANYCAAWDKNRVCDHGSWLVTFFFTYALTGLPAFYYALKRMERLLAGVFSMRLSKAFVVFTIPLTTLGVMLGLFERSNSWEVLTQPFFLVKTALGYFQNTDTLAFFGAFTASLYAIYYGFGAFIRLMTQKR